MNKLINMVNQVSADGGMAFFTIFLVGFSFVGGLVPSAAHAYYSESCYDCGSSYTDSIDWGSGSSYPSYTDSIDWSYAPTYPSYADSIDLGYAPTYPSYTDSIDWSYAPSYPSYYSTYPSYYYTPSYSYGGCTFGCGGSYIQPPMYVPPVYVDGKCYNGCGGGGHTVPPVISTGCTYSLGGCGSTYTTPSYSNSNTNVNTNINTNTNTNTYYNIQTQNPYVPTYTTYVQPTCTITYSQPSYTGYSNYNQGVLLSWTSANAGSAYISSIGSVSTSGSQYMYPSGSTTYTMTVYGTNGGSNSCSTTVPYTPYIPPVVNNLYCSITASPNTIQNGANAVLSWTSYGANYATLSDGLGNVAVNGSLSVRPEGSRVYTLTVRDYQGRTNTCYTTVSVNGSYVSLTSIPYTGFDGGITENTVYWLGMALWALAAGFVVVRFRGNVGAWFDRSGIATPTIIHERTVPQRATKQEVVSVARTGKDAMTLHTQAGQTPRLVITRA